MIESKVFEKIIHHIGKSGHVSLFLDYDGTLLPIAPIPNEATPDKLLIELLTELSKNSQFRVIVISGRSLKTLMNFLPIKNINFAGIYGWEIYINGKIVLRGVSEDQCMKIIREVRRSWSQLLEHRNGFLLEEKGYAIALHARWAKIEEANLILEAARKKALELIDLRQFRLLNGNSFLEVAPISANKGLAVDWILTNHPYKNDLPVYFGDDNKDEEAFGVIQQRDGYSIAVGSNYPLLQADEHLASPEEVRRWLKSFISISL
jgi:trehalose 6-phosphate phosphatase